MKGMETKLHSTRAQVFIRGFARCGIPEIYRQMVDETMQELTRMSSLRLGVEGRPALASGRAASRLYTPPIRPAAAMTE